MKVLFAVSNDNITTSVVNKFQQKYKEIITTKSVYYFNAIVNELKRDKEYNAIVIEEDLEPISNNNYEKIDRFISEKLDNISDEASRPSGEDIPIILICSDRRTKSDQLLRQLFSMGIYNALVGNDRSLDKVCDLMKKPRNKRDAKQYYGIETDQVEYESHRDEIVSEEQIQNILNYYKKIGTNEKKCVQAFERISKQYDSTQLRIIVKFLPIDVKAILEAYSPIYQKLMSKGTVLSNGKYTEYRPNNPKKPEPLDFITRDVSEQATNLNKPVVIPSNMNAQPMPKTSGNTNPANNMKPRQDINSHNPYGNNQTMQVPQPQQHINQANQIPQHNYNQQMPYGNMMGGQQQYNPYQNQPYNPYVQNQQMLYGNNMIGGQQPYNPYQNQPYNPYGQNNQTQMFNNGMDNMQGMPSQNPMNGQMQNPNNMNQQKQELQNNVNDNTQNIPNSEQSSTMKPTDIPDIPNIMNEIAPIEPMKPIQDEKNALTEQNNDIQPMVQQEDTQEENETENVVQNQTEETVSVNQEGESKVENIVAEEQPIKRRRGRPRKIKPEEENKAENIVAEEQPQKRRRGRPRKISPEEQKVDNKEVITNISEQPLIPQPIEEMTGIKPQEDQPVVPQNMKENADELISNIKVEPIEEVEDTNVEITNNQPINEVQQPEQKNFNLYDLDINNSDNESVFEQFDSQMNEETQEDDTTQINQDSTQIQPVPSTVEESNSAIQNEDAPYLPMMNNEFTGNFFSNPMVNEPVQQTSLIDNKNDSTQLPQNTSITGNGKIVAFVGTSKNGTSFIVNNIAQLLAQSGVRTAILDLTKNKNSYYMFTDNNPNKTKNATESLKQLSKGQVNGLEVQNNLSVFTALPGDDSVNDLDHASALQNASSSFEVVLLDCDYNTANIYFENASEIYLVQSMDAFTIQPLTKFLSNLKLNNILDENKLRIVINKSVKLKKLNTKMIVGGMSKYNEPSMTLQRDLFNPRKVQIVEIPFDDQTYLKYLECIAMCELTLNGYSREVLESLEKLKNMVYPLIAGGKNITNNNYDYNPNFNINNQGYQNQMSSRQFNNSVNDTLNRMRNNNF